MHLAESRPSSGGVGTAGDSSKTTHVDEDEDEGLAVVAVSIASASSSDGSGIMSRYCGRQGGVVGILAIKMIIITITIMA